jgi:hypothetical protein
MGSPNQNPSGFGKEGQQASQSKERIVLSKNKKGIC